MLRVSTLLAAGIVFLGSVSRADDNKREDDQPFNDANFVKKVASCGLQEVALGKIAAAQAKNADVKAFAEKLVADHEKANEALKKAASEANVTVPQEMDEKQLKEVERFHTYKGTNFDGDFMKLMLSDHEKAVTLFTRASKEAKNPAIKEFARNTLPIIEGHLAAAKKIKLPE